MLYLWVGWQYCGCLCLSLEGVDFEHNELLCRGQMSSDRTDMPAPLSPTLLPDVSSERAGPGQEPFMPAGLPLLNRVRMPGIP